MDVNGCFGAYLCEVACLDVDRRTLLLPFKGLYIGIDCHATDVTNLLPESDLPVGIEAELGVLAG